MSTTCWHAVGPIALAAALAACGGADAKNANTEPLVPVRVAEARLAPAARTITGVGVLASEEQIALAFKVGGIVSSVPVREGDVVAEGQVLATVDPAEIGAQVARTQVAFDRAQRDLERARNLYRDSVATLEQLQNATSAADVARADLEVARFNRRYATIVAPARGTVLRRMIERGELVGAGMPVIVISGRGLGDRLRVGLADRDIVRVKAGDRGVVRFDAYASEEFAATVTRVGAAAQPQTGTYDVELSLATHGRRLPVGLIGSVEIQPLTTDSVLLVPIEAIAEADGSVGAVYAVSTVGAGDQRAHRVPVEIAYIDGGHVALSAGMGLRPAARVVTAGAAYLEDGARVRVLP